MGTTKEEQPPQPPRVLFLDAIGKTTALIRAKTGALPGEYVPTLYDSFNITAQGGMDEPVNVEIWEAHSREDYDRLRPLSYTASNAVVICYPAAMPKSIIAGRHGASILTRCHDIYIAEWKHHAPDQPAILLRTMCDLDDPAVRDEEKYAYCSWDEAEAMAKENKIAHHMKCSAFAGEGLQEVLNTAAKLAIQHKATDKRLRRHNKQPGRCQLL